MRIVPIGGGKNLLSEKDPEGAFWNELWEDFGWFPPDVRDRLRRKLQQVRNDPNLLVRLWEINIEAVRLVIAPLLREVAEVFAAIPEGEDKEWLRSRRQWAEESGLPIGEQYDRLTEFLVELWKMRVAYLKGERRAEAPKPTRELHPVTIIPRAPLPPRRLPVPVPIRGMFKGDEVPAHPSTSSTGGCDVDDIDCVPFYPQTPALPLSDVPRSIDVHISPGRDARTPRTVEIAPTGAYDVYGRKSTDAVSEYGGHPVPGEPYDIFGGRVNDPVAESDPSAETETKSEPSQAYDIFGNRVTDEAATSSDPEYEPCDPSSGEGCVPFVPQTPAIHPSNLPRSLPFPVEQRPGIPGKTSYRSGPYRNGWGRICRGFRHGLSCRQAPAVGGGGGGGGGGR